MGQKVNPYGFRLGVIYPWKSKWYADKDYAQALHEDIRMRRYITEMCSGWEVQQVRDIVAETLHEIVDPLIYDEAAGLIEDHKAAVQLFETAADDANLDLELRSYAKRTLPTLRDHLKQAQTIKSKLAD